MARTLKSKKALAYSRKRAGITLKAMKCVKRASKRHDMSKKKCMKRASERRVKALKCMKRASERVVKATCCCYFRASKQKTDFESC